MGLFGGRSRGLGIYPGDVFRKVGNGADWVVEKVFEYNDIPPHVRLTERIGARAGARTMTVAASMLLDADSFTQISSADQGTPSMESSESSAVIED